jgi:hypothetical protein
LDKTENYASLSLPIIPSLFNFQKEGCTALTFTETLVQLPDQGDNLLTLAEHSALAQRHLQGI